MAQFCCKEEMPVSANTLFHFTRQRDVLMGILKNGFYPRYSLEDLSAVLPPEKIPAVHVPMVCFCDILLSQLSSHIEYYGEYGVGLRKKEWGIPLGISPVLYVDKESRTASLMHEVVKEVIKRNLPPQGKLRNELLDFCKYIKAYEGPVQNRMTKEMQTRRFYDEREWRFSPSAAHALLDESYNDKKLKKVNHELLQHGLKFKAKDVKYIIVSKEAEIAETIEEIQQLGSYDLKSRNLLASKVISAEQVKEDM